MPEPAGTGGQCAERQRRGGLGRAVIRHAVDSARGHASALKRAVDLRNIPAVRLYRSTGFLPRDRRAVHLAIL